MSEGDTDSGDVLVIGERYRYLNLAGGRDGGYGVDVDSVGYPGIRDHLSGVGLDCGQKQQGCQNCKQLKIYPHVQLPHRLASFCDRSMQKSCCNPAEALIIVKAGKSAQETL